MSEQPTTAAGPEAPDSWHDLFSEHSHRDLVNLLYVQTQYAIEAEARQDGSALRDHRCDYRCSLPGDHAGPHLFPTHTMPAALPPSAPPALDVERLALALHEYGGVCQSRYRRKTCSGPDHRIMASALAVEYARLQEPDQ